MEDKKSPHFQSDLFSSEMLGQLKSGFESPKSQRFMYKNTTREYFKKQRRAKI